MPTKFNLVDGGDDHWAIQLDEGKYAGIVYRYGTIKFVGEDEEGNGRVTFEYDILDPRDFSNEELVGPEIDAIMGEILHNIIVESMEYDKEKNLGNDRENYSEESDKQ